MGVVVFEAWTHIARAWIPVSGAWAQHRVRKRSLRSNPFIERGSGRFFRCDAQSPYFERGSPPFARLIRSRPASKPVPFSSRGWQNIVLRAWLMPTGGADAPFGRGTRISSVVDVDRSVDQSAVFCVGVVERWGAHAFFERGRRAGSARCRISSELARRNIGRIIVFRAMTGLPDAHFLRF